MNDAPLPQYLRSEMDPDTAAHFRSTKTFANYPCAHRQWRHEGNCRLVHGYSRSFHIVFAAKQHDRCGFIVDFGNLKWLRDWLDMMFDHTLLLEAADPHLAIFADLDAKGACALRIMPYGVGMEGTARLVCEFTDHHLRELTQGRCWVESVEARENDKNSAIYINPVAGWRGWLK
jgi:6-pyruvoyltetrahydropterin/6-carboxytetrahydropterin synthase